jgi:hypothetical protein
MSTTQLDPKWKPRLSDKVNTMPDGWDLSEMPERPNLASREQKAPSQHSEEGTSDEFEARERADFQLDPHLDRRSYPSRRDLSAY